MEKYVKEHPLNCQKRYTEAFKRKVCNELITSGANRSQMEKKYKLGNSRVVEWLKELGYSYRKAEISTFMPEQTIPEKQPKDASLEQLKRELEDAKLQAEAYRRMIELAEKELNISIRKKSNTE